MVTLYFKILLIPVNPVAEFWECLSRKFWRKDGKTVRKLKVFQEQILHCIRDSAQNHDCFDIASVMKICCESSVHHS